MPYLNPPQNGVKPSSRFSSLNVFKLKSTDAAPPPPPKDYASSLNAPPSAFYNKSLFSRSAASLVPSLSPQSTSGPATPSTPYPPFPSAGLEFGKRSNNNFPSANGRAAAPSPVPSASGGSLRSFGRGGGDYLISPSMDGSTDSGGSCPVANPNIDTFLVNGTKPKKSVFKLANLAKRNRSKKDLSDTVSVSGSVSRSVSVSEQDSAPGTAEGDEGISMPWNFQHNIHVDEGYIGLPPSWSSALSQVGFDDDEIAAIHARRKAAATSVTSGSKLANPHTTYSTERPPSPHALTMTLSTTSTSFSTTLLEPAPRSTSLGKGQAREALTIHPPSLYSRLFTPDFKHTTDLADAPNTYLPTYPSPTRPIRCWCITPFLGLSCTISARPFHLPPYTYPTTWIHI
ncbi:hypothetical protein OG21DRAFT_537748 [Imleria badia]|nr:hypothetical protein OG21DRAFT_537748 [Imleria badia]